MVLCFVTLTDLQMRRAGLSASAELLVWTVIGFNLPIRLINSSLGIFQRPEDPPEHASGSRSLPPEAAGASGAVFRRAEVAEDYKRAKAHSVRDGFLQPVHVGLVFWGQFRSNWLLLN